MLGGPRVRYGWVREVSPPLGFELRTVHSVASRYTDYAIPVAYIHTYSHTDTNWLVTVQYLIVAIQSGELVVSLCHHTWDSRVDVYHHSQRNEERAHCRKHNIALVVVIATCFVFVVIWVIPATCHHKFHTATINQFDGRSIASSKFWGKLAACYPFAVSVQCMVKINRTT